MSPLLAFVPLDVVIDLAVKSLAVMFVACVCALLVSRASAAWRHLVWSLGVAALMLLPALSVALPTWRASWVPDWQASESLVANRPVTTGTVAGSDVAPHDAQPSATPVSDVRVIGAEDRASRPTLAGSSPTRRRHSMTFPWTSLVMPAWLIGAALAIAPLAIGLWQLRGLRRGAVPVNEGDWLAALADARQQLRVKQQVRLEQSPRATMPLTWGVLRPVLLLPTEAGDWLPERRRMVLWHELAHIRRWDWLTQLVASVACAVYWFNPLVWLAARQMRTLRERACDDLVLRCGAKASDYAQQLLELAAGLADPQLATFAAVPMARRSVLESRLRAILDNRQSRAALTTAVVLLAACLAGAATAPLAMLRAAQPKPPKPEAPMVKPPSSPAPANSPVPAKAAEVSPRSPTAEEIDARTSGIRLTVLNSKGDKGIAEFRVIAGVPAPGIADEYEKRTGRTVVNWQPHTLRIGKDGDYVWPLAKAYDEMAIRIEADGYQPQIWAWLKKADGVQHVVFQLTEDKGVAGRVLTPDDKPAAGATVALALPQKDAVLEGGKLRGEGDPPAEKPSDRWRRPTMVKTDAEGRFTLPTEFEPAAVLVVHESGVRELTYDVWKKSPEIKLDRWGQLDGRVLWKDKPGADEEVTVSIHRDEYGYPGMVASYGKTRTDKDGRFTFEKVLPGLAQISRPMTVSTTADAGATSIILDGQFTHVTVKAGEPTPAMIGGQGRRVTGKLVGLDSWKEVTFHFHPTAPHVGFPGDDAMWKAFGQLKQSAIGPLLFRDKQAVRDDGTLLIENMLPGNYQLFVSAPGFKNYAASTQVRVEPELPGQEPAAQDLGTIEIKKPVEDLKPTKPPEKPKEAAKPTAESPTPANKTVTIRGKALDDETGKPIERLITQAGKFNPADPTKVTWGFSEGRSSARDGSFSTTVRWGEGWTARVLADGYIPQPVITAQPPGDKDEIVVTLRLKRGRLVSGVVLDHAGRPLAGAAVFALGPTLLNLVGGEALRSWGEKDDEARPVITDAAGRFELPAGEAKVVCVSHKDFDAWPTAIPDEGPVKIVLPAPARVEVELAIDGADKESKVFYQLLSEKTPEFASGLQSTREVPIVNGGKVTLAALPPGTYQICRTLVHRTAEFGTSAMLDREFFKIKAGETKSIRWVRTKGARLRGKITWPEGTVLSGTIVSVNAPKAEIDPLEGHEWQTTYSSLLAAPDGTYLTERVAPGTYLLRAQAYVPLTPEERVSPRLGLRGPAFEGEMKIEVPAEGELKLPDLPLVAIRR